jgi:hypothetical protein
MIFIAAISNEETFVKIIGPYCSDFNFQIKSSSLFILNHEMFLDKWSVKLLEVKEKLVFYTFLLCTQYLGVQFTT